MRSKLAKQTSKLLCILSSTLTSSEFEAAGEGLGSCDVADEGGGSLTSSSSMRHEATHPLSLLMTLSSFDAAGFEVDWTSSYMANLDDAGLACGAGAELEILMSSALVGLTTCSSPNSSVDHDGAL